MGDMSNWPYGFTDDPPRTKRPKKCIVAFAGRNGCGKETAAKWASRAFSARTHTYSDVLIETFGLWLPRKSTRPEQQALSTFMRSLLGEDAMAIVMVQKCLEASGNYVVIDGVRRPSDIELLCKEFGEENVHRGWIETAANVRYERLKARKAKGGEQFMTWDEFLVQEAAETEQLLDVVRASCAFEIDNNTSLDASGVPSHMYLQLERALKDRHILSS
jgi:dephospho-CoA kinase